MIDPYRSIDRSLEFRPIYSAEHTARMVQGITQNPHLYTEQSLKAVKDHAAFHKIPFEDPPEQVSIDPKENEFNLLRGVGEIGEGFISGFSTFNVGEPSPNTYEQILRSVGHLAGFVGYIPAAPFTAMKAFKLAGLAKALKGRSVPMVVATQVQKQARKIVVPTLEKAAAGRAGVTKQVSDFLLRDTPSHLAEGAFHLGLASAVGSWQFGVDEMLRSGAHGAVTGAAFRGIGEIFKGGGVPKIDKYTGKRVLDTNQQTDRAMRMLSSSLYEGLQSTYRGETTPEQIYSYLLGAFFGAHETSVTERAKNKFMVKMEQQRRKDPSLIMNLDRETGLPLDLKDTMYNPKLIPGYEKESRSTQKAILDENKARFGTWLENPTIAKIAVESAGIIPEDVLRDNPEILAELQGVVTDVMAGDVKPYKPAYISEEEALQMGKAQQIKATLLKVYKIQDENRFDKIVAKTTQPKSQFEKQMANDPVFKAYRNFMLNKTDVIEVEPSERKVSKDHKMNKVMVSTENVWGEDTTTLGESESGRRTATTRSFKLGEVGQIFTLEGKPQRYEVIEVEQLTDAKRKDPKFVKKWSVKEGWTEDHFKESYDNPKIGTVGPGKWQTTFRKIETPISEVPEGKERPWETEKEKATKIVDDYFEPNERVILETNEDAVVRAIVDGKEVQLTEADLDELSAAVRQQNSSSKAAQAMGEVALLDFKKNLLQKHGLEGVEDVDARLQNEVMESIRAEESVEASDTGTINTSPAIEGKARQFLVEFMAHRYSDLTERQILTKRNEDVSRIYDQLDKVIRAGQGKLGIRSDQLIDAIQKEFDIELGQDAKNSLRQMLRRKILTKNPQHYSIRTLSKKGGKKATGIVVEKLNKVRPVNAAGNAKDQADAKKVYEDAYLRVNQELAEGNPDHFYQKEPWVVIDHYIKLDGKHFKESALADALSDNYLHKNFKIDILRQMSDPKLRAKGMGGRSDQLGSFYYYSGKSDAGRMYFYRYHPETLRTLGGKGKKGPLFKYIKETLGGEEQYKKLKEEFMDEYSHLGIKNEMGDYFDQSFVSNVLWQIETSGLRTDTRGYADAFKMISDSSEIASPKMWNKRMQIWMTDGQEADPAYYQAKSADIDMTDRARQSIADGKLRYTLYEDAKGEKLTDKSKAEEFTEATDGAIDVEEGLFDILNNDFGMPVSGQNKSFIVEPNSKHGALLGKFMFHRADPEQSSWMRKKGLHLMMPRSSAKDSGTRTFLDPFTVSHKGKRTTIREDQLRDEADGGKIYELDIKAIKGLLSEANTDHLIQDQSTPKQIMTNLTRYAFSEIPQETIDNMFNTWTMPKFLGEGEYNDIVSEVVKKAPKDVTAADIKGIVDNLDKVGLPNLLDAIHNTRHHTLVGEMYKRILKINADTLAEQKQEGEITNEEYESALRETREFNSSINRMMTLNPHIAVFHYKDARGWLQNAMRNFAVHTVTRPKQPNSLSLRMRPYNPWMKAKFPKLNDNDRLFLLDDLQRERVIDLTGVVTGKKYRKENKPTLGMLWDEYRDKLAAYPKVKEFLNAIALRVPMDSLSGAHDLEFAGFTGIKGHGGVLHPRVMQALGGADLDGDKAFILFGQPKEFRETYNKQRTEYLEGGKYKDAKAGTISKSGITILNENPSEFDFNFMKTQRKDMKVKGKVDIFDNKVFWGGMVWRNLLTYTPTKGEAIDPVYDKMAMYTPQHRMAMSDGASAGRYQLGPAVVSRAVLNSTHASLMASAEHKIAKRYINKKDGDIVSISEYEKMAKDGKKLFKADYRDGFEVEYKVTGKGPRGKKLVKSWVFIEPRKDLAFARDLYKSEIGFTSDPMDEVALAGRENYFNWGYKAFFKVDMSNIPKQFRPQIQPHTHLRNGRFQQIYDFNHGYFGRNWQLGRRHTPSEIKSMAREILNFDPKEMNTFLPKMADILQPLELSDDIITRYDAAKILAKYEHDPLNDGTHPIYQWADALGRETFSVKLRENNPARAIILNTINNELGTSKARADLVTKPRTFNKLFGKDIERLAKKGRLAPYHYDPYKYEADLEAYIDAKRKAVGITGKPRFSEYALMGEKLSIIRNAKSRRLEYIESYVEKANDFLQNDQLTRGAADVIMKYIERGEEAGVENLEAFIKRTASFASRLKQIDRQIRNNAKLQTFKTKFIIDPRMLRDSKFMGAVKEVIDFDSKIPIGELRRELDHMIHLYKYKHVDDFEKSNVSRRLSQAEMDIVDALILSPFYKGKKADIDRLNKFRKKYPEQVEELIKELKSNQDGTYFSKIGINSPEIGDQVITDYLKAFSKEFDDVVKHGAKEGRIDKTIKELDGEIPIYRDPESGEPVQPDIFENDLEGLQRLTDKRFGHEKNIDADARQIMTDLSSHLQHYENSVSGKDINLLMRGMIGKNIDAMDLEDFRTVNNIFNDMRTGNWFLQNFGKLDKRGTPLLSKRHWMMFPKAVSDEMILKDFILAKQEGAFLNYKGELMRGTVAKPTHYIERTQYAIGTAQAAATRMNEEAAVALQEMLTNKTGYESIDEGYNIYRVAFTERELSIGHSIRNDHTLSSSQRQSRALQYRLQHENAKTRANWDEVKNKKFTLNVVSEAGKTRQIIKTGEELKDMIKDVITEVGKKGYKWIRGAQFIWDENIRDWVDLSKDNPSLDPWNDYYVRNKKGDIEYWDPEKNHRKVNVEKFVDYLLHTIKEGKVVPMDFGLDGMRNFELSVKLGNRNLTSEYRRLLINQAKRSTDHYKPETYNPHFIEDKPGHKKALIAELKRVEADEIMPDEMKQKEVRKLIIQYHRMGGDWMVNDIVDWHIYDKVLKDIAEGREPEDSKVGMYLETEYKAGSMHTRQGHLGPWRSDPSVWEDYQKNLIDTYYRQIGQVISRSFFNDFVERYSPDSGTAGRKMSKDAFEGWSEFYADYIGGALGFPSQIPDAWLEGSKKSLMNVSGTPYAWWADNRVSKRLGAIKKALGIKTYDKLPEELQGLGIEDIRHWSNLEAKFEMAALLAHPKSMMGNMYGGTLHTIQSVGWGTWRRSRQMNYLRTLQPGENWETVADLDKWAIGHGVVPEFIRYEAGLNPQFKGGKWKDFMSDAVDLIKNDPRIKDKTLLGLAKEHGITEAMFHKAAWFMREPERILRRQAFVAHWLQAREQFGRAGIDKDHPMLINFAKKGVQATQFLYSAPYRPAFSRTSLGKVMTRFQTWAWNAVRFRREIIQEARRHGYREGTTEFDRFKRLMLTDMFVFSLANVFAYSLFEAALPAPWSWFQDTADWIFGDEGERDKAFFGQWPKSLAPLQVITPPIARLPVSALRAFADDDWSRLSGYYIWTMFPFGRIARDIKGVMQNPMMTVEKMTGLPYIQFAREATKYRKGGEEEGVEEEE